MKILPLGLIALLSPVLIFSQEVKVKGQVIIHNTKQGVYPAQIKSNAKDFTSISTNSQGDFELPFADTDIGKDIELVIEYPGYEVVNKEVLTINIPKPKFQTKKLEIYLCKIGEWEQNFARLNNLHFKWLADAHQKKLNDLKKQLKINKSKAENSQEAIKILTQQYENQKKIIENLSQQFAKTHLPNKTESFKAAYKLFEQGTPENLKNAIKLLESDENDAKAFKNKAWNEMYIEEQLLVAKIYSVLSDTAKAEATYIKILNIDPTSPEALYQYGNYLQEHDKQSAAIEQYEKVLTLVDKLDV